MADGRIAGSGDVRGGVLSHAVGMQQLQHRTEPDHQVAGVIIVILSALVALSLVGVVTSLVSL